MYSKFCIKQNIESFVNLYYRIYDNKERKTAISYLNNSIMLCFSL